MRNYRRFALFVLALFSSLYSATAHATQCPAVMIILDTSGSMTESPDGNGGASKLSIAQTAIGTLVDKFGNTLPLGLTTFAETGSSCTSGIQILVQPTDGAGAMIKSQVAMAMATGDTNTGEAIDAVVADLKQNDSSRPASFIILITDGEPNCGGPTGTPQDPSYTVTEITKAATAGIKTFVVGFGQLPTDDATTMDNMATAGGVPCTGMNCSGKKFYAAESAAALDTALNSIQTQISGEFTATCDDSCYSNGCSSAGQVCVNGACAADPCLNVSETCAPGDYCFTDGTSPGMCEPSCTQTCASGQICELGECRTDVCASVTCPSTQICNNGQCVPNNCLAGCATGLVCYQGACIDDPCRYVVCPTDATCVTGTGACAGTGASSSSGGKRSVGGCMFAAPDDPGSSALIVILFGSALALFSRPRPRS